MTSIKFVYVVCETCGVEVDRVEYDEGAVAPAVSAVMDALNLSEDDAVKLVKKNNPGAEKSSWENATDLARAIASKNVDDRPEETYLCLNGHTEGLKTTEDNPTPAVVTAIARKEGD